LDYVIQGRYLDRDRSKQRILWFFRLPLYILEDSQIVKTTYSCLLFVEGEI
jgi:hypothetical protein